MNPNQPGSADGSTTGLGRVGDYKLLELLGKGGMGEVYKAQQPITEQLVALKVIRKSLLDEPGVLDRFLQRDIKLLARLNHPNIVRAYAAGQDGDTYFLVMELIEGQDLARMVQARGPLPVAEACAYVRQAARGLQHALTKAGIIHRDIKPHNLILDHTSGEVKILDMGLARSSAGDSAADLTSTGRALGTPLYMAPEQHTDARTVDTRADIYSLGCTLCFLLAGQFPPPFRWQRPDVPEPLLQVLKRMLETSPQARYTTPGEVADALAPFADSVADATPEQRIEEDPAQQQIQALQRMLEEQSRASGNAARTPVPSGGNQGETPADGRAEASPPGRPPSDPVQEDLPPDRVRDTNSGLMLIAPSAFPFLDPPRGPDELGWLGGYRVLRVLDEGGMGVVFEAEEQQPRRRVALKVMVQKLSAIPEARERFLREGQAAATVQHDRVVPIYRVDEANGMPFLVMPLLPGESLETCLRGQPLLPFAEALWIGWEAAEGLAAIHEQGLIHRDIKPGNIWLKQPGRSVVVLDFGLARALDGATHLPAPGSVLGTPMYVAPEQAARQEVSARADLFSLGCVLYRLVTGRLAFSGGDTAEVLRQVAEDHPTPPHDVDPYIPKRVSDLVQELLAKDPKQRPESARMVVERLRTLQRPEEPPSKSPTVPPPRPLWRRRWIAVAAGFVVVLLILGVAWDRWLRPPAEFEGEFNLWVVAHNDKPLPRQLPLGLDTAMSLKQGDGIVWDGELTKGPKAFFYLLWIGSDGKVTRLHPTDWTENQLPPAENAEQELRWPTNKKIWRNLAWSPAGVEANLCLVRERPLTRRDHLRLNGLLSQLNWHTPAEWKAVNFRAVWWKNGLRVLVRGAPTKKPSSDADDPITQTEQFLLTVKELGLAQYSRAVCFWFEPASPHPPKGGNP